MNELDFDNNTVTYKNPVLQSTWELLFDCKVYVAGQTGMAKHELEKVGSRSDYLRKIFAGRVAEGERLMARLTVAMNKLP